ncbi:MAG: hypothetical protein IJF73_02885 [Clostridia bacterium]|nr:hypothetical protein [Clostridia bacterium]
MVRYNKNDATLGNIAAAFQKRLRAPLDVTIVLDGALGEFTGKWEGGVCSAGSYGQLYEILGRLLRDPALPEGTYASGKELCGMYFATHFRNYLDEAPIDELCEYVEDLAFWGMNALELWLDLHHFRNMGEARPKTERLKAILRHARKMGIPTVLMTLSNEAFHESVRALRADWTPGHDGYVHPLGDHFHVEICPSKPGGMDLIKHYRRAMLEEFRDTPPDYVMFFAYDEGGCSCHECAPWGGNGHIRVVRELIPLCKEYFPEARFILSAWQYGTYNKQTVEFDMLAEALKNDPNGDFCDVRYVLSEPQYANYAYRPEVDMGRPLISFPEISMYKMKPWGGYGANPLPKLFDRLWERYGGLRKLEGTLPYSEGIYEDLNKVIVLRHYRDGQPAAKTIREYLAYETGLAGALLEETALAVEAMEETHNRAFDRDTHTVTVEHPERIEEIEAAILRADAALTEAARENVRWQLLYLRARIDGALKRAGFVRNAEVRALYEELARRTHLTEANGPSQRPDLDDGDFVFPPKPSADDADDTPEEGRVTVKK